MYLRYLTFLTNLPIDTACKAEGTSNVNLFISHLMRSSRRTLRACQIAVMVEREASMGDREETEIDANRIAFDSM